MATTQNLTNLNINVLTKEQLDNASLDANEIYCVTDDIMPIEFGGTGASNANVARDNLGITSLLTDKVDKDGNKVLSTNDYTNEDKTKVSKCLTTDDQQTIISWVTDSLEVWVGGSY